MTITPLATGALVHDRYRIVRAIGRGGMGAVYEALDTRLGSTVALKQTLAAGESLEEAFAREARLLASLRHAALPVVSDYFADGDGRFLVMQYIPGDDFGAILERRTAPFAFDEVLRWADLLLDALDYLHTQSPPIIHRDIKPQNLKLTPRGEIVLLDFGLAKSTAGSLTGTGSIFGYTPQYAPLEQIRGTGTDARSDLYALAATLYHLLTNTLPPNALDRAAAALSGQPDPLRPIAELNPAVPSGVAQAIERALALDPAARPLSAAMLRADLAGALRSGSAGASTTPMAPTQLRTAVAAPPPPTMTAPPPAPVAHAPRPTSPGCLIAAGLAGLLVLVVAAGLTWLGLSRVATIIADVPTAESDAPLPTAAIPSPAVPAPTIAVPTFELPNIAVPTVVVPTVVVPTVAAPTAEAPSAGLTQPLLTFGEAGTGQGRLENPRGVAIGAEGAIFVSDYTTGRVQKFDAEGRFVFGWVSQGETPILALISDRAGRVYVVRNTGVQQYDGESGELLAEFGADAGFEDLAILADRSLIGIEWGGNELVRLDPQGRESDRIEAPLEQAGSDDSPMRLAVDGLGNLFLLDSSGTTVYRFSPEGRFVDRFAVEGAWGFSDLAVDGQGRIYVSLFGAGVAVFDAEGRAIGTVDVPGTVFDMKFDDADNLYVVTSQSQVVKLAALAVP